MDTLDMGFDRLDARLQWQLAPELVCTPSVLDFGCLAPHRKAIREVSITNLNGPLEHCTLCNRDEQSWFRIVQAQGISGHKQAHMRIVVEVDPQQLRLGQPYTGWLDVTVAHTELAIPLRVAVAPPARPQRRHGLRLFAVTSAMTLLLSGCLAFVSTTPLYVFLERFMPMLLARPTQPDPNLLSFVVQEQDQLTVYNMQLTAAGNQAVGIAGWSPTWSPDGAQLAFLAEQDGVPQLYVTDLSDAAARQITTLASPKAAPAWSPDGRKIAFMAGLQGAERLQVVGDQSLRGGSIFAVLDQHDRLIATINRLFTPQNQFAQKVGHTEQFAWAPDGAALLFDYYTEQQVQVMLVQRDGGMATVATDSWHPTWSPTGDEIAAVSAQGLFRLPLGRATRHYLSQQPATRPAWSPDGQQLAFLVSQPATGTGASPHDLWLVDAGGAQARAVATNCVTFAWSPDGRHLAYVTGDSQGAAPLLYLWVLTADQPPRLLAEVNAPMLAWRPIQPPNWAPPAREMSAKFAVW